MTRYSYLGLGTVVKVAHPAVSGGLTLSYGTAANHYSSLDRFGRVKDQIWTNGSGGTTRDRFTYAYDRNSNRLSRSNYLAGAYSEAYAYDGLDRLVDANRGGNNFQDWTLDNASLLCSLWFLWCHSRAPNNPNFPLANLLRPRYHPSAAKGGTGGCSVRILPSSLKSE